MPPHHVSPASFAALPENERCLGPYRLSKKLGHGGFAPVWLAEEIYDEKKLRDVALKLFFLPEEKSRDPQLTAAWRDAILDEARALCRVEHAHVVRFYSLQRDDARGIVGLAMEYIAGKSLDAIASEHGRMPERAVLEAAIAVAWALAAVHNAGLVHRDIKPANIVKGPAGYKLIDFGIAAGATRSLTAPIAMTPYVDANPGALDATMSVEELAATAATAAVPAFATAPTLHLGSGSAPEGGLRATSYEQPRICGTLGFIPPECIDWGEPASPAGDLYALGVTIFRLLTGLLPGEVSGTRPSVFLLPTGPVPRLEPLVADPSSATGPLAELTASLLNPDPNARPRYADWVARELERIHGQLEPTSTSAPRLAACSSTSSAALPSISRPNEVAALRRARRPYFAGDDPDQQRPLDASPPLTARDEALTALFAASSDALRDRARFLVFTGPLGVGRTRLLDKASTLPGFDADRILRLQCSPERKSPLHPLRRALEPIRARDPGALQAVFDATLRAASPGALPGVDAAAQAIEAVEDALLRASAAAPLLLLIDDVQWGDPYTVDLLKLLIDRAAVDGSGKLLVVVAARDEPSPSAPLRSLLAKVRARAGRFVRHVALGPLAPADAARLARAVAPIGSDVEEAVVRGSGGVPFFVVHALLAWRDAGAITWREGAYRAAADKDLRDDVPGVADRLEGRIASYFEPGSAAERSALRALSAVALYGGGLGVDVLFRVVGDEDSTESALEILVSAGILVASGEPSEYSFAQEMVRQAALNRFRPKPWFHRIHRALLDAIAERDAASVDAAFLSAGYEKLGAVPEARLWLGRAMRAAVASGLFTEAAELGDRLAAITKEPDARATIELDAARALILGRRFEDAARRLDRIRARYGARARGGAVDLRLRISRLEVARGRDEASDGDPTLLTDVDASGDLKLRCEGRMALAGVSPDDRAMQLASEAVEIAARGEPSVEFAARVLRFELNYGQRTRDLELAEVDLQRALVIADAVGSPWRQIHIEGDLAVLEAERGRVEAAIARLRVLASRAEALGMRGQLLLFTQNLSAFLLREGHAAEAAETALRTAELATEGGDPVLRATSLSLRAEALRRVGDFEAALRSADQAEELQRERGDRWRALTLLRRAEILDHLGRGEDALDDARSALAVAQRSGDTNLAIGARLWEALYRVRRGDAPPLALSTLVDEVDATGVTLRSLTRTLLDQAKELLAKGAAERESALDAR